jgi:hypothetical protein
MLIVAEVARLPGSQTEVWRLPIRNSGEFRYGAIAPSQTPWPPIALMRLQAASAFRWSGLRAIRVSLLNTLLTSSKPHMRRGAV